MLTFKNYSTQIDDKTYVVATHKRKVISINCYFNVSRWNCEDYEARRSVNPRGKTGQLVIKKIRQEIAA